MEYHICHLLAIPHLDDIIYEAAIEIMKDIDFQATILFLVDMFVLGIISIAYLVGGLIFAVKFSSLERVVALLSIFFFYPPSPLIFLNCFALIPFLPHT